MVIWKLTEKLLSIMITLLIITGFKYISGSNIQVLEGSINIDPQASKIIEIAYPKNFNFENCIPISCGIQQNKTVGYNYIGSFVDSTSLFNGAPTRYLNLKEENISLEIENPATDDTVEFKYKIILLKYETSNIEYTLGDVNQDGTIDSKDVQMIQDYIMGNVSLSAQQFKAADINEDGKVTSADYVKLKNQLGI